MQVHLNIYTLLYNDSHINIVYRYIFYNMTSQIILLWLTMAVHACRYKFKVKNILYKHRLSCIFIIKLNEIFMGAQESLALFLMVLRINDTELFRLYVLSFGMPTI